jgi:hypothetical protein
LELFFVLSLLILEKGDFGEDGTAFGGGSVGVEVLGAEFLVEDLFDLGVEFGDFVGMDFGYVL